MFYSGLDCLSLYNVKAGLTYTDINTGHSIANTLTHRF
jgi:hypothetical protein